MAKNILLIRFSSRLKGNCSAISAFVAEHYAGETVAAFTVDNQVVQACNNCNYECLQPGRLCPNLSDQLKTIMDAISTADLVYYIVPNYCGYPSANYFTFNERSVGYFNMDRALMQQYRSVPKRFIVVSNTEGQNFENAFKLQVTGQPEILYLKTSNYHKQSTAGDMMESADAKADLKTFLEHYGFL